MERSRVVAWLQLAAMAAAVSACTYPDIQPVHHARALLQQQPLNISAVALAPSIPFVEAIGETPEQPPEPASSPAPWPQPPHARRVTARVGQVEPRGVASVAAASTTVAAQQGFWRRGNLIYADKVYLTQNAGARAIPGYKTAVVAAGEDLTVYAVDVMADDLTLPGRNVTIVAHNVACGKCVGQPKGAAGCVAGSWQVASGDADINQDVCDALGKTLVTVDEALEKRQQIIDARVLGGSYYRLAPQGAIGGLSRQLDIIKYLPNRLRNSLCCTPGITCGCTIDVSGARGSSQEGKAANGRDAGSNGAAGAPGGDGAKGGSITLRLPTSSELEPASTFFLRLAARGGSGGHGQEGGDGVQGARGTTAGSTCHHEWYNHPGRVGFTGYCQDKQPEGIDRRGYYGATGGRGGNGGNGGDNGFNGRGGAGGTVRVIARQTLSPAIVQTEASGGAGGMRPDDRFGQGGRFGEGGGGGPGAWYRIDRLYSNPFGCGLAPCCCYEKPIILGCNGVSCKNLYDKGWPGFTGPTGNWGRNGKRWEQGGAGTAGNATSVALRSQPGSVPAAAMRLWLSQVQNAWLSGDNEAVTTILSLLSSVSPCSDIPSDCADIAATITVLVSQLNSGLDYYGNRPNFVPSLSLGAIQAYTCNTLLPLMQTLETSINSYQAASDNAAARKSAASGAIQGLQDRLRSMRQDLAQARVERGQLYLQQDQLRTQRDNLRRELDSAIGVFEQAISDKIRKEAAEGKNPWELLFNTFTDVLDVVAQVQKVASKGEVDALGKAVKSGKSIYDQWNKFLKPLPAPLNIDEIAVADSMTQVRDTFKDWSQFNATASKERRKQAMLKEQWEKLIRNYTSLETGEKYQLTLAAYDDACGAYNQLLFVIDAKTLAIMQAEQTVEALEAQLPQLRNNLDELMAQDEPWVAQFLYRAYEMAKSAILRNLFQQAAASNFIYGTADRFTVQDTSYNGLLAKSAELQEGIFRQLQSTNPATPTTFVRILLNNRTVPGFDAGLRRNSIDFQLSPCLPAFYAYASVFVREFRVRFIGAVARPNAKDPAITVELSTPGTSIVRSAGPQLTLFPYVMMPRQSDFFYYLDKNPWTKRDAGYFTSEAVPPTARCAPLGDAASIYSPLSPLAPWTLSFPQTGTNRGVDFSAVTAVQLEFRGTKVAPSRGSSSAMDAYCESRGEEWLSTDARVVSDVQFVAGRRCPRGTQLVRGSLNARAPKSGPVHMCVETAPAALAPAVVSELMLVRNNNTTKQQARCPDMFYKAGVDFNLGVEDDAVAACVMKGAATGGMIAELRVVRHKDQCKDGELVSDANAGTTAPSVFLCKVSTSASARARGRLRVRARADSRVHTRD